MAIRKKCILKFNLDNYYLHLADGLFALGRQAVNEAVRRYDRHIMNRPHLRTHQLRNSIGMAVYIDGKFDERLCYRPKPSYGKPKKWHGKMLRGNIESLRLLRSLKPSGKVTMVLVAAMPYRELLEGRNREYGSVGFRTASGKKGKSYIKKRGFNISNAVVVKKHLPSLSGLRTLEKNATKYYRGRNNPDASMVDRTGLGGYIVISDMYHYLKTEGVHLTGKVERIVGGDVRIDSDTKSNKGKIVVKYGNA